MLESKLTQQQQHHGDHYFNHRYYHSEAIKFQCLKIQHAKHTTYWWKQWGQNMTGGQPTSKDSKLLTKFQSNTWTKLCPKHVILLAATHGEVRRFKRSICRTWSVKTGVKHINKVSKLSTLKINGNDGIIVETLLWILIKTYNMKWWGSKRNVSKNLAPKPVLLWGQNTKLSLATEGVEYQTSCYLLMCSINIVKQGRFIGRSFSFRRWVMFL